MLIECHECKARVDAEEIGHVEADMPFWRRRTYLLKCPACNCPLVGECDDVFQNEEYHWTDLVRVYPKPPRTLTLNVPEPVQNLCERLISAYKSGLILRLRLWQVAPWRQFVDTTLQKIPTWVPG